MVQPSNQDFIHRFTFRPKHGAERTQIRWCGLGSARPAHDTHGWPTNAVLLVAQANGFRSSATTPGVSVLPGNWRRDCDLHLNRNDKWFPN